MKDTGLEEVFDFPKVFEYTESDEENDNASSSSEDESEEKARLKDELQKNLDKLKDILKAGGDDKDSVKSNPDLKDMA